MLGSQHSLDRDGHQARGFAFVELLCGLVLIVVCSSLLIGHLAVRYKRDTAERNRVFAFMAAKSILAEVHAWVEAGRDIYALDDGGVAQSTLSLAPSSAGGNQVSGNFQRSGEWVWWRQIRVHAVPGVDNRDLSVVTVSISKWAADGSRSDIASMSSVVTTPTTGYPTTQVFDLYLLAIENIPGRNVQMESIRPFVESVITDLERANPGLEFRTHWITKASYGRDPHYTPAITDGKSDWRDAYSYPSKQSLGESVSYYYVPDMIKGRIRVADAIRNDLDPNKNPLAYSLADAFNHGMRLPEERAMHEARLRLVHARKQAILSAREGGAKVPTHLVDMSEEPTLRLLLEDLNSKPEKYRHALILNLHGDVLPMPAIRNYSDAASDPTELPGLRCVAHPEELRTRRDPTGDQHDSVAIRVYAYSENPDVLPEDGVCPEDHAIAMRIMGVDLTDPIHRGTLRADVRLENLYGGVPITPVGSGQTDSNYRSFGLAKDIYQPRGKNEMFYLAQFVDPGFGEEKYTLVWLFNTPVTARAVRNSGTWVHNPRVEPMENRSRFRDPIRVLPKIPPPEAKLVTSEDENKGRVQGLNSDQGSRLYNLEYIPSPTGASKEFTRDLATPDTGPKNTARWRLLIPGTVFRDRRFVTVEGKYHDPRRDVRLTVKTGFWKLGAPEPTGYGRVSTAYTWWGAGRSAVPFTERSQFLGDPRHCPYKDVAKGDADFADGYNWYFDSLRNNGASGAAGYPTLDSPLLANGWLGGHRFDVPRYLAVLRQGLLRSGAVFGSLGGSDETRVLLGGETREGREELVRQNGSGNYWWSRPWLGELCPDSHFAEYWSSTDKRSGGADPQEGQQEGTSLWFGNLPAGTDPRSFSARNAATVYGESMSSSLGVSFATDPDAPEFSWQAFFNAEVGGNALGFVEERATGPMTDHGKSLGSLYRVGVPQLLTVARKLAWTPSGVTPEWANDAYGRSRCRARIVESYCDVAGGQGSALVELVQSRSQARVAVHGMEGDVLFRARHTILSLLHGHLTASRGLPPRVRLLAPTEIDAIVDPVKIPIHWEVVAERWDGRQHTPAVEAPNEAELYYALLYSSDNGSTWRSVVDDSLAEPGERPAMRLRRFDGESGPELYQWETPANRFPAGRYLLRVDVFSTERWLHGAYHVRGFEIVR